MDRKFIPVAMLAGALALAGCGGGSSTTAPGSEPEITPSTPATPATPATPEARPATLTGTGLTNSGGTAYDIRLEKDETYGTPNGGTITCPTNECVITVGAQRGTPTVTATGGATFAAKAVVRAPREDRTAGGGDSSVEWLSDRNLLNAVKTSVGDSGIEVDGITITDSRNSEHILLQQVFPAVDESDATSRTELYDQGTANEAVGNGGAFNSNAEITPTSGSKIGRVVIEAASQNGDDTTLRLVHTRGRAVTTADDETRDRDTTLSDYLVFGTWLTVTGADDGPQNDPRTGVLVAGTLPVDTADLPTTGDARYEGKALGHYKRGKVGKSDPWSEWEGTVDLKANFSRGTSAISGQITTNIPDGRNVGGTENVHMAPIALGRLTIGQSGKVSGVGAGTWEAGFYGTPINGAPNGIAGSFQTIRNARPAGTLVTPQQGGGTFEVEQPAVVGAVVQGAFGAHHVGCIPIF